MKKLVFLVVAVLAIGLTSCNVGLNEPVNPQSNFRKNGTPVNPSNLPQVILNYISTNYPNQTIVEAESYTENSMTYYEVELDNGIEFYFDSNGNVLEEGDSDDEYIDPSTLPQAILDYIAINYPNLTIEEAEMEQDDNGNTVYEVELSDDTELYFDANGNLLASYSDDDDDDDDSTSVANLPTAIQQYIATNYSGYTVEEAEIEDLFGDNTQQVYEVELEQGNQEITLYFDMAGTFIQEEVEILSSALPTAVSNTITSQYGSYQMDDEADQYNRANGDIWYGVELESGSQEVELILDSNGAIQYTIID